MEPSGLEVLVEQEEPEELVVQEGLVAQVELSVLLVAEVVGDYWVYPDVRTSGSLCCF